MAKGKEHEGKKDALIPVRLDLLQLPNVYAPHFLSFPGQTPERDRRFLKLVEAIRWLNTE